MPVSDYDTNPDKNTAISGINIAEGCPPGNVNDAIRQMMADVKTLSVGSETTLPDATTTTKGVVMLAETTDTTSTTKSATPAGVKATVDAALTGNAALANAVAKTRKINTTAPLTGGGDLSADRTLAVSAATTSAAGVVQLATAAEATAGTDTGKAVTPAALKSALGAVGGGAATPQSGPGVGQWTSDFVRVDINPNEYLTEWARFLPSGGTWAWMALTYSEGKDNNGDDLGVTSISITSGINPGNTKIGPDRTLGFCWRIA